MMTRTTVAMSLLATTIVPAMVAAQPLRRDLGSYFIFAQKRLQAKNLNLTTGCNVGVNCAKPNQSSACGTANFQNTFAANGSQIASDDVNFSKSGADIFQLFTNGTFQAANVNVRQPPVQQISPLPIIPGTCDAGCLPNAAALSVECGFPQQFPACDQADTIIANGGDCIGVNVNEPANLLGNGVCDLPPGVYGDILVRDNGALAFQAGDYTACSVQVGKSARVTGGSTNIFIDASNRPDISFRVGNQSLFGGQCNEFTVKVQGSTKVQFGKSATVAAKICAPDAIMGLGHSNTLKGQFVGLEVNLDENNTGECCGGNCTCIDTFSPTSAKVGDTITMNSACDLNVTTGVKICGIVAEILTKSTNLMTVKVPVGASGACAVEVLSSAGTFTHVGTLTVTP